MSLDLDQVHTFYSMLEILALFELNALLKILAVFKLNSMPQILAVNECMHSRKTNLRQSDIARFTQNTTNC